MAEEKDFNIVSSEESVKTIDKGPKIDPPVKAPKLKPQEYDVAPGGIDRKSLGKRDVNYHVGIDVEDYKTDYNRGNIVLGPGGVEALNEDRANQQGWFEQARNMVGQAVVGEVIGGTIEGLGYIGEIGSAIDYLGGTEQNWGNWMTELGKDTREFAQENMAIHQVKDSGMGDSGWWFSNGVSVASSLSMLIPTGAATKALGMLGKVASKGAGIISKSLDIASRMGKYETWMAEGITQAIVSRHIESSMEASGVFNEQKASLQSRINPKTKEYFTEEEATQLASEGASSTYRSDWAMLLQDIPQYLALGKVFNPVSMKMESKIAEITASGVKPGIKGALMAGGATFASEGAEESYQYYVAERGKLLSDLKAGLITEKEYDQKTSSKIGDKEMLTSAFWGGLGGNIFQAAGKGTSELFKSTERKNAEANYATIQGDYIARRGASFQLMQNEIAKADQSGDPVKRQAAIDGSGVHMAVDAIDNGKFAEYIESLQGMSKMSQAEQAGFEKDLGIELDPELFKKYVPSLISQAYSIRESYLKHSNKYDSNIAAKMASNDHYVKSFDNRTKEVTKEIQNIKDSVPNADKLTSYYQDKFSTKGNLVALKKANEIHEAAMKNTESKYQIENRQALIDKNKKIIDKLNLKMVELNSNDPRTKDEKDSDKLIGAGYEQSSEDLIIKATEHTLLTDAINLMQKENIKLQSKSHQAELRMVQMRNRVKSLKSVEQAMQAKANIDEDPKTSKEKKAELHALVDKRIDEIAIEEKNSAAKAKQDEHKTTLTKEGKASAINNPTAVPDTNIIPVGKNLEDELAGEEVDIHGAMVKQSDIAKKKMSEASENTSIYGATGNKNYNDWMLNGKNKIGTPVTIQPGTVVYAGAKQPQLVKQAIADFNNGIINANVYNHLPLKVIIDKQDGDTESDERSAFLSARLEGQNSGYEAAWARQDFPIRKAFIDQMNSNPSKTTTSKVTVQYGGKVNASPAIDGVIPENNIGDLQHLGPIMDELFDLKGSQASPDQVTQAIEESLMYTNEFGELMNMDGERHKEFIGRQLTLPLLTGTTGAKTPMRGTIFLSVPKADGTKFPLKLNVKKHSQNEAEIIAGLLTSVITKENKFETPLSQMKEETRLKILETMKEELGAMEKSDPSLMDIVDFFTYVSPQTEGKASELFISGEWVKFGNADLKVTPKSLFNHEKLVEFLVNTKRRQFNVGLWQSSPAYRDYAISSGLINTDAVTNGPLFGGKTDIYIKAPDTVKPVPVSNPAQLLQHTPPVPGGKPKSERRKMSEKAGTYSDKSTNGKFAATYYDASNTAVEILRDTAELAKQAVNDKYNAEKVSGPATKVVVQTQKVKKIDSSPTVESIEKRRQEDLAKLEYKFGKFEFNTSEAEGGVINGQDDKFVVSIALKANTNTGYLNSKALSGRFDTREEARAFVEETVIPKIAEKVNAKYDAELKALNSEQNDMSNLPEQETGNLKVVIRKDDKSNFNLIIKDGGVVVNESTGKELDPKKDAKLINKALLKSGLLKYEKITVGKQVYAATAIGTIINITPGSPSNGNQILATSSVGAKVMAQYTGKFTGKVEGIGSEEVNKLSGEDLVREMLNGKSITDFTVEEQRAIDTVPLDRKKEIQAEIIAKNKAGIKEASERYAKAMQGKAPAREMSDEEINQIYQEFVGMLGLVDNERIDEFIQASAIVILSGSGSYSAIQRGLKLGYNRAARYIDMLESMGLVRPYEGSKAGALLVTDKDEAAKRIKDSIAFAIEIYQSKSSDSTEIMSKEELDNQAYEAELEASRNPVEYEVVKSPEVIALEEARDEELGEYAMSFAESGMTEAPESREEADDWKKNGNPYEKARNEIRAKYDLKIKELLESPKISDPRMLLMGMNSLDLSNELAIEQEQADLSALDEINNSTSTLDVQLETEKVPDFNQVSNDDVNLAQYNEEDSLSDFYNDFQDEAGCGF